MHLIKISAIFLVLIILIIAACKKDASTDSTLLSQPGDISTTEGSQVIGDRAFEGLNGIVDGYVTLSGLKSAAIGTCPNITATVSTSFPILITFDWGTGCTSADDGVTRSGKITASLSGLMNVVNSVMTFTFQDFVCDGNKITGTHKVTYKGLNAGNNWPRYAVLTEAKIEFPDKKSITYRAEYIRLQSEGANTLIPEDNVWRIEGNSSGVSREGVDWTASYPSALVKKASCKWFSSGTILITPATGLTRTLNFGDGICDNKATLKIGDTTINIEL